MKIFFWNLSDFDSYLIVGKKRTERILTGNTTARMTKLTRKELRGQGYTVMIIKLTGTTKRMFSVKPIRIIGKR